MMRLQFLVRPQWIKARAPHALACFSTTESRRRLPKDGLMLADFVSDTTRSSDASNPPPQPPQADNDGPSFHLKTYGCQMNVNDSDIVRSLLIQAGMRECNDERGADVLLTNTCAIREGAELKVWHRLQELKSIRKKHKTTTKVVGVLGCMAERLKENLLENGMADLVVGPDAYRDLPNLVRALLEEDVDTAVNVQLSLEETYADVTPVRRNPNDISAFVSVMRGCNNMCSYCVVPFTRGRERSRPLDSIVSEVQLLMEEGVKEIVLLGQNVNSYHDKSDSAILTAQPCRSYQTSNPGFSNLYRLRGGAGYYFADLVEHVSDLHPELRVRFTSPHPKDYPPELLQLMAERANVCNQLHMPAQSGSSSVLQRMRRGYTREAYLELIDTVISKIPDVAITSDFIVGFCGETQEEHEDTLSLMEHVKYDQAFMFAYSMRGKTHAHRQLEDNVPKEVKQERLQEIINMFRTQVQRRNDEREVGRLRLVLVEGESKKSRPDHVTWHGRTDQNKRLVFPMQTDLFSCRKEEDVKTVLSQLRNNVGLSWGGGGGLEQSLASTSGVSLRPGDYAVVQVTEARGHTLRGQVLWRTTLSAFAELNLSPTDEQQLMEAFSLNAITAELMATA